MAGKGATFDSDILKLIFNGTNIALLADNTASTPLTVLYLALHTADPTVSGNQSTSEATYTGYTRVTVARTTGGWTVTGASVSPNAVVSFPIGTGGSGTATFASVGTAATGTGKILWYGALSPTIPLGSGITPTIAAGSTIVEA